MKSHISTHTTGIDSSIAFAMGTEAEKEYAAFEEKVKRTVYLDNLSPHVAESDSVIKSAFEQYGKVTNIHFIPNYTEPFYNARCALVEMENVKQASTIIDNLSSYPFMISGMPRPVKGRAAEPEMFDERPVKPGRRIQLYWLDPKDPGFEVAQQLKKLTKTHFEEKSFLLKKQQEEEEKLSKQQAEALKVHYQKYEMMDSTLADGSTKRLARHYEMSLTEGNGS